MAAAEKSSLRSLLALKRFLRGPFRRFGVACLAFGLILNMTVNPAAQTPSPTPNSTVGYGSSSSFSSAETTHALVSNAVDAEFSDLSRSLLKHRRFTHHQLTHHRLTSARLSIPHASEKKIASLAR